MPIDYPDGFRRLMAGHSVDLTTGYSIAWYRGTSLNIGPGEKSSYTININDPDNIYYIDVVNVSPKAYAAFGVVVTINNVPYESSSTTGVAHIPMRVNPSILALYGDTIDIEVTNYDAALQVFRVKVHGTKISRPEGFGHVPAASFTASIHTTDVLIPVLFTDESSFDPTSWEWDLKDGSPLLTSQNPSVVFKTPGSYYPRLKAINQYGHDTYIEQVPILVKPVLYPTGWTLYNGGVPSGYTLVYPPEYTTSYIKTTNEWFEFEGFRAVDPSLSLTGGRYRNSWLTENGYTGSMRFHVAFSEAKVITRIKYCNSHHDGYETDAGVKDFTIQGSNSATAFANLAYADNTDWTNITANVSSMVKHTESVDAAEWHNIELTNATAYKYYAIKCANNHGDPNNIGLRRVEFYAGSVSSLIADDTSVSITAFPADQAGYVSLDRVGHLLHGFSITFKLAVTLMQTGSRHCFMKLANTLGSETDETVGDIGIEIRPSDVHNNLLLRSYLTSGAIQDEYVDIPVDGTPLYFKMIHSAGSNDITLYIYSDSSMTTLLDTLSLTNNAFSTLTYRYVYLSRSYIYAGAGQTSAKISNVVFNYL
jgi:PKD repeat protein